MKYRVGLKQLTVFKAVLALCAWSEIYTVLVFRRRIQEKDFYILLLWGGKGSNPFLHNIFQVDILY